MNGFERFNIRYLSPTMIAQWDAAPATLILKRIYGVKGKATASMWRGEAVEAGLQFCLHNRGKPDMLANAKQLAVATFWDRAGGEVTEETEAAAALVPNMVEQASLAVADRDERIMGTQFNVEHWLDGVGAPVTGKIDFLFEDKRMIELKSTTRIPSCLDNVSLSHRWQAGLYAAARQHPVDLVYVSAKKWALYEVKPDDASLLLMRRSALAMQRALEACEDGGALLRALPLNVESFYWDEDNRQAYEDALDGELKVLTGPGTESLAAQGYIAFGKHAGKHVSDVPPGYLDWLLDPKLSSGDTFEVDPDLQNAIREMRSAT